MRNPLGKEQASAKQPTITLQFLQSKPKSIARDFYIWMFLDQDITIQEAKALKSLIYRENAQLTTKIARKIAPPVKGGVLGRSTICQRMSLEELLKQDAKCIGYALKLSDASRLPKAKIRELSIKLKNIKPKLAKQLAWISAQSPLTEILKQGAGTFAEVFNGVELSYRVKELNRAITPQRLKMLANQNNAAFTRLLRIMIMNPHYDKIQESLAKTDGISIPNAMTIFYVGLNALKYKQKQRAISYFKQAANKIQDPLMRDRIDFWLYKATGDISYLQKLAKSTFPSIHAIYATQKLNVTPSYNIVYEILDKNVPQKSKWDITDPFAWIEMQKKIKNDKELALMLRELRFYDTEPHYALALRRETKFKNHYYIRPYRQYFAQYSNDYQALMYAIGLQESFFIPASVSIAYALGMMQIVPFNVGIIAKKLNEQPHLTDMFDPETNIRYAAFLLQGLIAEFREPLFIAYAYNGGAGFTRKMLQRKDIFQKSNPLDPWISLEYVPYQESRYYGQRVLANYIIYQRVYGKHIRVEDILYKTLINP